MGGALRSIGSNFTKILKPIAQTALKAVTPQAMNLLKSITSSGFDGIKNVAQSLVSRLPGIGQLASKLLGKGFDKLQGLALDGIQKFVSQLLEKLQPRNVPGTSQTVTTPGLNDRAAGAAGEAKTIQDLINMLQQLLKGQGAGAAGGAASSAPTNNAGGATGTSSSAATGGAASTGGAAATGGGRNIEDAVMNGSAFNNVPAEPVIDGTEDEKTLAKKQAQLQKYARMMQAITAFLQASHEMKKGIIQNFRV